MVDLVGSLRAYGAIASYVLFSPQSGALANVSGGFETGNPERGEFETYIGTFPVGFQSTAKILTPEIGGSNKVVSGCFRLKPTTFHEYILDRYYVKFEHEITVEQVSNDNYLCELFSKIRFSHSHEGIDNLRKHASGSPGKHRCSVDVDWYACRVVNRSTKRGNPERHNGIPKSPFKRLRRRIRSSSFDPRSSCMSR